MPCHIQFRLRSHHRYICFIAGMSFALIEIDQLNAALSIEFSRGVMDVIKFAPVCMSKSRICSTAILAGRSCLPAVDYPATREFV